eukprot:15455617-Alexandrium_andersonii.AAC.2
MPPATAAVAQSTRAKAKAAAASERLKWRRPNHTTYSTGTGSSPKGGSCNTPPSTHFSKSCTSRRRLRRRAARTPPSVTGKPWRPSTLSPPVARLKSERKKPRMAFCVAALAFGTLAWWASSTIRARGVPMNMEKLKAPVCAPRGGG